MRLLILTSAALIALSGCSNSNSDNDAINPNAPEAQSASNDLSTEVSDDYVGISDLQNNENTDIVNSDSLLSINADNYEKILKSVVSVLNLEGIDDARSTARDQTSMLVSNSSALLNGETALLPALDLASQTPFVSTSDSTYPQVSEMVYICENQGSFTNQYYDYGQAPYSIREIEYDNCALDDITTSGGYGFTAGRRSSSIDTFTNYQMESDTSSMSLNGIWEIKYPLFGNSGAQTWSNATIVSTGNTDSYQIDDLNWNNSGTAVALPPPNTITGYVTDLDGVVRRVRLVTYSADFNASFKLKSELTQQLPLTVDAQLKFRRDYFTWEQLFVDGLPLIPDYPVSDLGSPFALSSSENFDDGQTIVMQEQVARDTQAQWQSGELVITAEDGSQLVMTPVADDKTMVNIKLNGAAETISALWEDDLQIDCIYVIEGCGRDEPRVYW